MAALKYIYGFGDHREHRVKVEKKLPDDPELSNCVMRLKAASAAPPEDVVGAPGYADFVAAMTDANHPEHQSMHEWYSDSFDPTFVDVFAISLALHDLKICFQDGLGTTLTPQDSVLPHHIWPIYGKIRLTINLIDDYLFLLGLTTGGTCHQASCVCIAKGAQFSGS